RRISALLSECLGREPSEEELSEELGLPRRKLSLLTRASQRPVSLDAPVNEDDTVGLGDVIGDEKALSPLDTLVAKNIHDQLEDLLAVLDPRERQIIEERFGLDGIESRTLEEVGGELGVTRERIRQLQNLAVKKMRAALRKKEKPLPKAV
ncbi:MAG: RNA polymerase subunit sigma, partial [Roseibacillus sp.]|nr:RNA polymerase subunit sigma [Roseibacillus sp.]